MAQRHYNVYADDDEDDDGNREERDLDDSGESDVDVEGVEDNFLDGNAEENLLDHMMVPDNGHAAENGSDNESVESLPGDDEDRMLDIEEPDDDEDDDAMTWESLSTVSGGEAEVVPDTDEWYPMIERRSMFPNFALPTTTRQALILSQEPPPNPTPYVETAMYEDDAAFLARVDELRPDPTKRDLSEMVLDYFLHHGHSEVIETFCREMDLPMPLEEIKEMEIRNNVKKSILEGNMEEALEKMNAISPDLIKEDMVNYEFRKQHIIEMIRNGVDVEAVAYFREHLMIDGQRPCDERMEIIEKIFTLMVLSPQDKTEFHVYFDQGEREKTAKEVNSAILAAHGKPRFSRIDMLAKSMVWMRTEVMNSVNPKQKTTSLEWASKFFDAPFGFHDLIEAVLKNEPLDFTKEFC